MFCSKKIFFTLALFSCLFILPTFCLAKEAKKEKAPQGIPVSYIEIEPKPIPVVYDFIGTTDASERVEIRARVQGFLEARLFEEGELVRVGQPLYRIEQASYKANLEMAQANLLAAQANQVLESKNYKRAAVLLRQAVISQSEFDVQNAKYAVASANVASAKASFDNAQLELSYTNIVSPVTGYIGKSAKDIGSLVDSSANSYLTEVVQSDPLYVNFSMSELEYLSWQKDLKSKEIVIAKDTQPYLKITMANNILNSQNGTLNFESPDINATTGTVQFRAYFSNLNSTIKPGQFVNIQMMGFIRNGAIVIPERAVSQSPVGSSVMIIGKNNIAESRAVEVGAINADGWFILSGLKKGDKVVVDGLKILRAGMPVMATPFVDSSKTTNMTK